MIINLVPCKCGHRESSHFGDWGCLGMERNHEDGPCLCKKYDRRKSRVKMAKPEGSE